MKKVASLERLSRIFKTFPVDFSEGVLTLDSSTGSHECFIKDFRFIEYRNSMQLLPAELGRRFAVHELISRQPPALESYGKLWEWIDVPEVFRLHRERFRELIYQAYLRALLSIDFEEGLPARFIPKAVEGDEEFLPSLQLHRFAADILKNSESLNDYEAFSPETIFVASGEISTEVSFEALLVFQLLKEPKTFLEVLDGSFYPPNRTTNCIRELLRLKAIAQMGGGIELSCTALSESLSRPEEDVDTIPNENNKEESLPCEVTKNQSTGKDKKLSEVVCATLTSRSRPIFSARKKTVTNDYLLTSLSYLVLFLLLSLPWFLWHPLFTTF